MKTNKNIYYSFNHVKDRLEERFGLSITWEEYNALNNKLRFDKAFHVLTENNKQEIHRLVFKGKLVTFDYNLEKQYVTTAMDWV